MANERSTDASADAFFDDEQELIAEEEAQSAAAAPAAAEEQTADDARKPAAAEAPAGARPASGVDAPPFWMVIAIAVIALLLGVVIGYLLGASTAFSSAEAAMADTSQTAGAVSADALPEGHPGVTIDPDGTAHVTEEGSSSSAGGDAAGGAASADAGSAANGSAA